MFRSVFALAMAAGTLLLPSFSWSADTFPSKPIHLVSHSKPGGGMDIILRHLAVPLEKDLGVSVVVEDRPGGSSAVAMTYVATSKNPGYTVAGITNTQFSTSLTNNPPKGIKDLRSVCKLVTDPLVMFVSKNTGYTDVKKLLSDVKSNPDKFSIAASQVGSVEYLIAYDLVQQGYKMTIIPFEAGGELTTSVIGGHVDIGISEPSEVMGQATAGNINILCTFTGKRLASFPDVPTAEEAGLKNGLQKVRMIMVPKETPDNIVARLEEACRKAMDDPEFKKFYESNDMVRDFKDAKAADMEKEEIIAVMTKALSDLGILKR